MKPKKQILLFLLSVVSFVTFSATALASVTPTLNLTATGSSDNVQIAVNADPNSSVILYYTPTNSVLQIKAIGTTNSSGYFSNTFSSSSFGLTTGNPAYVSVGGINGLISSTVLWPTVTTTTVNSVTLNQTALVLSVGQTNTVTATNNTQNALYILNNSNAAIASAAVNGNQITVLGLASGSTTVTVCSVGNTTNCPTLNVTVQGGGTQTLTFSQSNVSLSYGQSTAITISGGTGSYMVSGNSSSGNVTTSISGSILTLGGSSNTSGTYSITVCSTNVSSCGVVTVTLGGTSSGSISFSQTAPVLTVGQTMTVSISGSSAATYYIASNTNPSIVQANISGSTLTLLGAASGTVTINVCVTSGNCNSLKVTVNNTSSTSQVYLAQNNLTVGIGQTSSVAITGGTTPYILITPSNDVFQAGISGGALYVTGANIGSAQITVCSSTNTGCASLSLHVTGTQTTPTTTNASTATSFLSFNSTGPVLSLGQSTSVSVSGGSNSNYTVAYNTNSNIVQATINGSVLSLSGIGNGHAIVVVCDSLNDCGALPVTVGSTTTTTIPSTTSGTLPSGCSSSYGYSSTTGLPCSSGAVVTTSPASTSKYQFTLFLQQGMTGNEVVELQKRLTELGYYNGPTSGNFGPLTAAGVAALQKAHGISAVGYVGPGTRAVLNAY